MLPMYITNEKGHISGLSHFSVIYMAVVKQKFHIDIVLGLPSINVKRLIQQALKSFFKGKGTVKNRHKKGVFLCVQQMPNQTIEVHDRDSLRSVERLSKIFIDAIIHLIIQLSILNKTSEKLEWAIYRQKESDWITFNQLNHIESILLNKKV